MKKLMILIPKKLMMFFGLLLLTPVVLLAQTGGGTINLGSYVTSFSVYLASLLFVVEFLSTVIKTTNARKWLTWVVAIVIGLLAFILKLGIFFDVWYIGIVYVLFGGLVTAGYLTAATGQMLVDLLLEWIRRLAVSKTTTKK